MVNNNIKKLNINDDLVELKYDYNLEDNVIKFTATANFKKVVYGPEEYAKLKAHFNDLVSIF